MRRYVLLLLMTAVTISCSTEERNPRQSLGDLNIQQIQRDLPDRICVYSPAKFWGKNLSIKSSISDVYINSEELEYELLTIHFSEGRKYIQIPINHCGLMESSIVRFNMIEHCNSPLSEPSDPKTFLIAQYPLGGDTLFPIFNIVTIIPQPKYMPEESINALDFFNKSELKFNGVVLYATLNGDFQRVDVFINGEIYFQGRLGNDADYLENDIYTKLLFSSEMNVAQYGDGNDDDGNGDDEPIWLEEAVIVADNPGNTGYIIDDPGINYPGPDNPIDGDITPPGGGGGSNQFFKIELIINVEGEGIAYGAGYYDKGDNVTCTASPKFVEETPISEFVHWSGFYESTESTISFTLPEYTFDESIQLIATFHNLTPCNDGVFFDPLMDMEICGTPVSGVNGGRFGNTRTDGYGNPKRHNGLDLLCPVGTPVFSSTYGTVVEVFTQFNNEYGMEEYVEEYGDVSRKNNGNFVFIESILNGEVYTFCYLHLNTVHVVVGDVVSPGQVIGSSGITGNYSSTLSGNPHLHLQIKEGGQSSNKNVDPEMFIYTKFNSEGNSINHCK